MIPDDVVHLKVTGPIIKVPLPTEWGPSGTAGAVVCLLGVLQVVVFCLLKTTQECRLHRNLASER